MTIGERIRQIRKEKGITQKRLAELSGISTTSIQWYEYDKYKPKIEQVERIAKALEVTPFDLMGFDYWDSIFDYDHLSKEVALLESISASYGDCIVQLICDFDSLNEQGKQKASDYISDLAGNPKYQK